MLYSHLYYNELSARLSESVQSASAEPPGKTGFILEAEIEMKSNKFLGAPCGYDPFMSKKNFPQVLCG